MKQNTAKQNYPGSVAILTITRLAYSTIYNALEPTRDTFMTYDKPKNTTRDSAIAEGLCIIISLHWRLNI